MNICYINPTNNIRRPVAELAEILAQEGHHISIMYPVSRNCPTENWVANQVVCNGSIKSIPIPSWYFAPLRYSFPNIMALWKATRKAFRENDKIHIWEYYYPLSVVSLLYAWLRRKERQTILTTDGFVGYSYQPRKPWWLVPAFKLYTQLVAHFLFKIPKTITTYGQAMIPFAWRAGVPMKKLRIIPTGIHLERFQHVGRKKVQQLRAEFEIRKEKIILFVGMLTERKGVDKVIKISQQLLREEFNIKTLIVGDAHGRNTFKKMVKPQFRDRIIFTGGRKDIPELMHIADVLLLPSEGEGLPGVVMEAMASGLPVVATSEGCISELVEAGKDGFLVKINDIRGYVSGVKKILTNEELAKNLSERGKEKIRRFAWPAVNRKYISLYR